MPEPDADARSDARPDYGADRDAHRQPSLRPLARDDGTFVMVAMDQRESLRAMLAETSGRAPGDVADEELRAFKLDVAEALAPAASGFLIDPEFGAALLGNNPHLPDGATRLSGERQITGGAGLIVAADLLSPRPGEIVGDARFDDSLDLAAHAATGVAAAKLLVVWRDDDRSDERVADAERFVAACAAAGLPSIVEGVVRATDAQRDNDTFDREATLLRCAAGLGALGPSLYKAEIPYFGRGEESRITKAAEELTAAVPCPWVVLSSHVERSDFAGAVLACCRGGASGLLAGRAMWTNALDASDRAHRQRRLREESVPFLRDLSGIVAAHGRPLTAVGP